MVMTERVDDEPERIPGAENLIRPEDNFLPPALLLTRYFWIFLMFRDITGHLRDSPLAVLLLTPGFKVPLLSRTIQHLLQICPPLASSPAVLVMTLGRDVEHPSHVWFTLYPEANPDAPTQQPESK